MLKMSFVTHDRCSKEKVWAEVNRAEDVGSLRVPDSP
jgi:hypothetical protein